MDILMQAETNHHEDLMGYGGEINQHVHVRVSPKIRDYLHVTTIIMENIMIHEIWLKLEWDGMGWNGTEWDGMIWNLLSNDPLLQFVGYNLMWRS